MFCRTFNKIVKSHSPRVLQMKQKMFALSFPIFMLMVYCSVEDKLSQKTFLLRFWHNSPCLMNSPFFAVGSFELRSLLAFPLGSQQRQWVRQERACWDILQLCQRFSSPCASGMTMLINLHFLPQAHIPFVLTVASCRFALLACRHHCVLRGWRCYRQYNKMERFKQCKLPHKKMGF